MIILVFILSSAGSLTVLVWQLLTEHGLIFYFIHICNKVIYWFFLNVLIHLSIPTTLDLHSSGWRYRQIQ